MVCTAAEMMAGRGEEEKEEREAFTCRVDSILGPAAMFRPTYHASIQTLFIPCSAVLSFLLNVAASSVCAASSTRPFNAGDIT